MTALVRAPAVAGAFYPAQPAVLRPMLESYLDAATPPPLGKIRALIVPHAGYIYSGPVAAFGYKLLAAQEIPPRRIHLMGPAHRAWFSGVALGDYDAFETPLGTVPVDRECLQRLHQTVPQFALLPQAHEGEHCLEVQLPFLQLHGSPPAIVPQLFGELDPLEIGEQLEPQVAPEDFIIVSSDLSHYHTYESARIRDQALLTALLEGDRAKVAQGEACGKAPILTLMMIAERRGWYPHQLNYRNSGDTAGDRRQVVGYAAIAYTEA